MANHTGKIIQSINCKVCLILILNVYGFFICWLCPRIRKLETHNNGLRSLFERNGLSAMFGHALAICSQSLKTTKDGIDDDRWTSQDKQIHVHPLGCEPQSSPSIWGDGPWLCASGRCGVHGQWPANGQPMEDDSGFPCVLFKWFDLVVS